MFSNDIVVEIMNYIDNNLYKRISIDELADYFSYNKDYIMRLFKRELNCTIINYINNYRIYNSLDTLKNINKRILNIALTYGFTSQEYYSEIFNKIIGVSPLKFRKFIYQPVSLSFKNINIIRENIVELNKFIKYTEYYKNNTNKCPMVKSLFIFK